MTRFTENAARAYDDYFRKVRACFTSTGAGDPDEIIADLQEHVNQELKDSDGPVSGEEMQAVLDRLGSPQQWVNEEELPWWRRTLMRIRKGPQDWRLAYASLGLLMLGVLLGWVFQTSHTYLGTSLTIPGYNEEAPKSYLDVYYVEGSMPPHTRYEYNWVLLIVFVCFSFILARAALASRDGDLASGEKWLAYPVLIPVYLVVIAAVVSLVPIAAGAGGLESSYRSLMRHHAGEPTPGYYPAVFRLIGVQQGKVGGLDVRAGVFSAWATTAATGIWFSVLGALLLFSRPRKLAAKLFAPFFLDMGRKWAVLGLVLGVALVVLAAVSAYAADQWGHVYF